MIEPISRNICASNHDGKLDKTDDPARNRKWEAMQRFACTLKFALLNKISRFNLLYILQRGGGCTDFFIELKALS